MPSCFIEKDISLDLKKIEDKVEKQALIAGLVFCITKRTPEADASGVVLIILYY